MWKSPRKLSWRFSKMTETLGLYIHVPFCKSRCQYCGFYAVTKGDMGRYVDAAAAEMARFAPSFRDRRADTLYLGGGTPSALPKEELSRLMAAVRAHFSIAPDAEITMEMNPSDMTEEYLTAVRDAGVNRLSIGVESHDDRLLSAIGRRHTAKEAEQAVKRAYRLGFHNISIDLMYDLPRQRPEDFEASLLWAMHLPITHLSVYSLIIEEGTPFAFQHARGRLPRPTEEESWAMYQAMCRIPPHYGMKRYEISSFARKGKESRHNEKYWRLDDYLGIGPGAASRIGRVRRTNEGNLSAWEKSLFSGEDVPGEVLHLTEAEDMEEYCFLHLRMVEGIDREAFRKRYGGDLERWYEKELAWLRENRLLSDDGRRVAMTGRGEALGNVVFEKFLRSL